MAEVVSLFTGSSFTTGAYSRPAMANLGTKLLCFLFLIFLGYGFSSYPRNELLLVFINADGIYLGLGTALRINVLFSFASQL